MIDFLDNTLKDLSEVTLIDIERANQSYEAQIRSLLEDYPLTKAIEEWNASLIKFTQRIQSKNKRYSRKMIQEKIFPEAFADGKTFTLGGFRHISSQAIIAYIKEQEKWSLEERMEMIEVYNAFTDYLNKISYGWFKELNSSYQMSLRAVKQTLSFPDWRAFIETLDEINQRDGLIARCLLQGEKRVSEVLNLKTDQINVESNTISFMRKKEIEAVTYEPSFIRRLKNYIEVTETERGDSPYIFITRNGKQVTRLRLNHSFTQASKKAYIVKVTPDSLRGIWKMFVQQQYKEKYIMCNKEERINDAIEENNKKEILSTLRSPE